MTGASRNDRRERSASIGPPLLGEVGRRELHSRSIGPANSKVRRAMEIRYAGGCRSDYDCGLMETVTLTIDGRQVTVEKGKTVLQAAIESGISVPYYCYHPGLGIDGSCRVCIVKIEKMPKLQTSCSTACADGMVVTHARRRTSSRRAPACSSSC